MSHELLAARILDIQASTNHRVVIGIAGSPGGGKTTLAAKIVDLINTHQSGIAVAVPMDGYHLANATLDRLGVHDRKGAIDTFDGWGFLSLIARLKNEIENVVYAPSFRREMDEGIAGEIAIEPQHKIVVVEGNYILADLSPWNLMREFFDESWFCSTSDEERLERLIDRHVKYGRTREAAEKWAIEVDGVNAKLIEATAKNADLIVSGVNGAFSRNVADNN